jgi:hypothetical protein
MGPWEQSVEGRLTQLHGDVRQVLQAAIGGAVLVLSALAAGFLVLSAKIDDSADRLADKGDRISAQISSLSERAAKLEGTAEANLAAPDKRTPPMRARH